MPGFFARQFDDSEEGPFEVTILRTNACVTRKPVPGAPKFFFRIIIVIVCSISFCLHFSLLMTKLQQICEK